MHKAARFAVADGVGHLTGSEGGESVMVPPVALSPAQDIGVISACSQANSLPVRPNPWRDLIGISRMPSRSHIYECVLTTGMVHAHPASTLNNRFGGSRRQSHGGGQPSAAQTDHVHFIPLAVETASAGPGQTGFRQVPFHRLCMELSGSAHRHRASIAVVAVAKVRIADGFPLGMPVLQRHFHRHFHRHRAGPARNTHSAHRVIAADDGRDQPPVDG